MRPPLQPLRHRDALRRVGTATALLCLGVLLAADASAHDVRTPAEGALLRIDVTGTPEARSLAFEASDGDLVFATDPASEDSALIVRSLDGGASSGAILLDRTRWSVRSESGDTVFRYDDPSGSRGGIRSVELRPGSLRVDGGGAGLTLEPLGSEAGFEVLFRVESEWTCTEFSASTGATVNASGAGLYDASDAAQPAFCATEFCGNGVKELGESCDDGNLVDGDACTNACQAGSACEGESYASTFEAIQSVVFEGYGCTTAPCHSQAAAEGGLDLTLDAAYAQLFRAPSQAVAMLRVEPGEPEVSFLYEKLAAKGSSTITTTNSPMPIFFDQLSDDHLRAVYQWIRKGAPETGVIEGTAGLLDSCLPPDTPLKIDRPPHPGPGVGVQFQQTAYTLEPEGEEELCMATFFDFTQTNLIPESQQFDCGYASTNNPSGKCFRYHRQLLLQDPQSHHSIIHMYTGPVDVRQDIQASGSEGFGPFTYKTDTLDDPMRDQPCDPMQIDPALGYNPNCSGRDSQSVACIGWGPEGAGVSPAFSGSQEPYYDQEFADGVYSILPMSGVVIWNSHAFNLTPQASTMDQYLNLYLAGPDDQRFPLNGIFDADDIFAMAVPPFETQEICGTFQLPKPAKVFQLSSHTHQWGTRFRIWDPPNAPCSVYGGNGMPACAPGPEERLAYVSTEYTDPVQLRYDPPRLFNESDPDDRRYLYCSVYDNGSEEGSPPVHRQGTSNSNFCTDPGPVCHGGARDGEGCRFRGCGVGAVCGPPEDRHCVDGPFRGALCGADSECDSASGAGDGICDQACFVRGGVKTTDEMFIMLGSYFRDDSADVISVGQPDTGTTSVAAGPAAASFCGLVGLELLTVVPAARWLTRRRRSERTSRSRR